MTDRQSKKFTLKKLTTDLRKQLAFVKDFAAAVAKSVARNGMYHVFSTQDVFYTKGFSGAFEHEEDSNIAKALSADRPDKQLLCIGRKHCPQDPVRIRRQHASELCPSLASQCVARSHSPRCRRPERVRFAATSYAEQRIVRQG